ncbi:MAG: BatA domain-containing protein, partial [Phycisphaerales bacterium]|nr:BatA domain-containing protein [Phycisphaerales bacterium]
MTFLHPMLAIAGLAAVAVPVIIHLLFRQRRRPVVWAAMRFLLEAYQKQRKKLRVQQWLLLACRCLVIALLALAVGRPALQRAGVLGGVGGRDVYVIIDDSLSSALRDGPSGETSLQRHARQASGLLRALGPGDRAGLVTLSRPASGVVVPASGDPAAVRRLIEELTPTDAAADLPAAVELLAARLKAERADTARPTVVAVFSDFTEGSADLARPLPPGLTDLPNVSVVASRPLETSPGNVQVSGLEPLRSVILTGRADA